MALRVDVGKLRPFEVGRPVLADPCVIVGLSTHVDNKVTITGTLRLPGTVHWRFEDLKNVVLHKEAREGVEEGVMDADDEERLALVCLVIPYDGILGWDTAEPHLLGESASEVRIKA